MNFKELIDPISIEVFFKEYFEKKFLHIPRQNPNYYNDILNAADIDEYLNGKLLRHPSISMVSKGMMIPENFWTKDESYNNIPIGKIAENDKVFDFLVKF